MWILKGARGEAYRRDSRFAEVRVKSWVHIGGPIGGSLERIGWHPQGPRCLS